MIDISVIVCTYNRCRQLSACLAALAGQTFNPRRFEVLIIDNNSKDRTEETVAAFMAEHPPVIARYILEREQGLSRARNRGVKEARGPLVAFIDDDGIAEPDWLARLVDSFADPSVQAVGGRVDLLLPAAEPPWLYRTLRILLSEYIPDQDAPYFLRPGAFHPVGCNLAFRREALAETGGFDPSLGRSGADLMGGEETKVLQELMDRERRILIQPSAVVKHMVPLERLSQHYFRRLLVNPVRIKQRSLAKAGFPRRFVACLRFALEFVINCLFFLLGLLTFPGPVRRFKLYFRVYRAWTKLRLALAYLLTGKEKSM